MAKQCTESEKIEILTLWKSGKFKNIGELALNLLYLLKT